MRTRVSLLLLLGLLMCGTSALAAESNDNERFPQNQEALSFALTATPAEAETAETEAEIKTATAFNAVETDIPEETDIVSSFEDLQLWLRNLDGYGGEVVLGDTITIEETISPSYNYTGPLSIDTGSFGLIYDGGYIDYCDLFLTGKGVDIPVLEIRNTGNGFGWLPPLDWNMVLSFMDVTALGRDGIGGTAVRITSDSDYRRPITVYESRGQIHSYGRNAVGLALTANTMLEVYGLDMDVSGDNSRAVTAINGAGLFLCSLSAQGEGAAVASDDNIVLDTCILSPEPDHAEVIYRTIKRPTGVEPQIQQYAGIYDVYDAVRFYDTTRFLLTGGRYLDVNLQHNEERLATIDTSVLGPVDFPITLPDIMQGFGLEGGSDFTIRLWVRDPALPVIKSMEQRDDLLYFFSWENEEYEPGTIILWCSEDNEKTWIDISNWDAVRWNDFNFSNFIFQLKADKITKPVSLALETKNGWSNIVTLTPGEKGAVSIGPGGDRDGGDRDEQPGDDGGDHGGGSGDDGTSGEDSPGGSTGDSSGGDSSGEGTGGSPGGDSSGGGTGGSPGEDSSGGSTGGSSGTITEPETETTPGGGNSSGNANGPGPSHGSSSGTSHGPGAETSHETDITIFPSPGANILPAAETETSPETNSMANPEAETTAPGKPSSSRPAGTSAQRNDVTSHSQKTSEQSPSYSGSPEPVQPETDAESSPTDSTSPSTDTDNGALGALESGSILSASSPSSPIPELALPALVFLSAGGITTCTVYRKKRRKNR
ncbi:MAG: hypothetical protein KHZ58_04565 [Hungatella hathewayi]|nr:hypothetical protein [Hungatella hathewayi]